jgi:hypothetical protein
MIYRCPPQRRRKPQIDMLSVSLVLQETASDAVLIEERDQWQASKRVVNAN